MAEFEEILHKCSVEELRFAAESNKLPRTGSKGDLVSRLVSRLTPKKILQSLSNKQLQVILDRYKLPKSGRKDELIGRILSSLKPPKRGIVRAPDVSVRAVQRVEEKETAYKKGHNFEKQVAAWANKKLKPTSVTTNFLANGLSVKRPYEIDVHVCFKGKGLFAQQCDVWIECKDRKSRIKRVDISKLVSSAEDVFLTAKAGREKLYFDRLVFASKSEFDSDAVGYADQTGVLCLHFDGKKFIEINTPDFDRDPSWLERAR